MAIIRCPYCHAIIDETDKYCNNCGTQLLFPDDETIEEEIPGEKIIEAETEEKDYELDEASKTGESLPHDEYEREAAGTVELTSVLDSKVETHAIEEILEGEDAEDAAAEAEPHEKTEEVFVVDEIEAVEKADRPAPSGELPVEEPVQRDEPPLMRPFSTDEQEPAEDKEAGEQPPEGGAAEFSEPPSAPTPVWEEPVEPSTYDFEPPIPQPPTGPVGPVEPESSAAEIEPVVSEPEIRAADDSGAEFPAAPAEAVAEPQAAESAVAAEPETEAAPVSEPRAESMTFDTGELEKIGETIDLSKARLDKVMDEMAVHEPVHPPAPPAQERTGTLPPWADKMKGAPSMISDDETRGEDELAAVKKSLMAKDLAAEESWPGGRADETAEPAPDEEEEIFPKRRDSDSGLGYPERLTQATLPFEAKREEETEEDLEVPPAATAGAAEPRLAPVPPAVPAAAAPVPSALPRPDARPGHDEIFPRAEAAGQAEEEKPKPPFSLAFFLKSKAFDVLFIGFVWLIALWLAAQSLGTTLFDMFSLTPWPAVLLYAVLVLLYFFLFKFFLGETLGDRLFKERD